MPSLRSSSFLMAAAVFLTAIAGSCAPAEESYYYCRRPDWRGDYVFEVPFRSGHSYDIYIFTRLEGKDRELLEMKTFPLYIEAVSPSGAVYGEQYDFVVPAGTLRSPGRRDAMSAYRTGAAPCQEGTWTVRLRQCGRESAEITEGFGLYIEEKDR